jgi:FAD-dependent urate hydroxylase
MSETHRALVAGAGIAGLTVAAGLSRLGWEVDLVERRETPAAAIPTGLFFPANGMRALAALGATAALLPHGHAVARLRIGAACCGTEGVADLADIWPGLGSSVAVHRGRALGALLDWCPVPARCGTGVESLSQRGQRVEVVLTDGSAAEYDLVVGADGAYSTVRCQFWPDALPEYGRESYWRGVVTCPPSLVDWTACFCAEGTFLAIPIGGGLVYWAAASYSASPFGDPEAGRAARVRERFGDVTGMCARVLSQVDDDARIQFSPANQVWVDMPVAGRVVLAGDAWHATTPSMAQGGSMAAEDALVLAQELEAVPDIDAALNRYARRRLPRTRHVQQTTAMRNGLAALPLADRASFVIPNWAGLSKDSFAALVPAP